MRMRRVQNRNTPPDDADAEEDARRTAASLRAGDAAGQVVDGALQNERRHQRRCLWSRTSRSGRARTPADSRMT